MNQSTLTVELPRRVMQLAADKLPDGVNLLLVAPEDLQPEFVRLANGRSVCPVTGMSYTWVRDLIKKSLGTKHPIKAHHMRERGNVKGTVLIDRASYVEFIRLHPPPDWAMPAEESPVNGQQSSVNPPHEDAL